MLALLLALPAKAQWERPGPVEVGLLVASQVLILYDGLQTLDIHNHKDLKELNPILGSHPSKFKIITYNSVCVLVNGLVWYALPTWYTRGAFSITIIAMQTNTILKNHDLGLRAAWVF